MSVRSCVLTLIIAAVAGCGNVGFIPASAVGAFDGGSPGSNAGAPDAGAGVDGGGAADMDAGTADGGEPLSSIDDFIENTIHGPQSIDIGSYRLVVKGLVEEPLSLTYGDVVARFPHHDKVARLTCVEGWSVNILWGGVRLKDIFDTVKVKPEASVVILRAYDGYSTSFPIDFIRDTGVILASTMNGQTIPPERGYPFMLAADGKWGYKWIKWITEIEPSDDAAFRGYWEQRGYSNDGSRDKPFFE